MAFALFATCLLVGVVCLMLSEASLTASDYGGGGIDVRRNEEGGLQRWRRSRRRKAVPSAGVSGPHPDGHSCTFVAGGDCFFDLDAGDAISDQDLYAASVSL